VHEVAFEMMSIILAFKRAEDDKLMKFQRAGIHGIVTLKPKVRSGIGGKRLFERNGRHTKKYP
jgi:hypothetical protein